MAGKLIYLLQLKKNMPKKKKTKKKKKR